MKVGNSKYHLMSARVDILYQLFLFPPLKATIKMLGSLFLNGNNVLQVWLSVLNNGDSHFIHIFYLWFQEANQARTMYSIFHFALNLQ